MPSHATAAIILAAGQGSRMRSEQAKVLHKVGGQPMVRHLLDALDGLDVLTRVLVVGAGREQVESALAADGLAFAVQDPPLGTGHAVMAAMPSLERSYDDILVLYGDTPLLTGATLAALLAARRRPAADGQPHAAAVIGFRPADPAGYGRLIADDHGALLRIVEDRDATQDERKVTLCNSGVMAFDGGLLPDLLARLGNDNAKGEYYLTDAVAIARAMGRSTAIVEAPEDEVLGVNTRADLAAAEAAFQARMRHAAMADGATLTTPETVYFSHDTRLGRDVTLGPHVVFGPGVTVADDVRIEAFCHLEGCHIASGAVLGPYARLRPGAEIGPGARVGNFVEIKKAVLGAGAKANHLSYIGDAQVGANANIGAGVITCNYDGFAKHVTEIGAGVFVGSNVALVAPVRIGDGALIGAGSTVSRDVPADAVAVTRAEQNTLTGAAARRRERLSARRADNAGTAGENHSSG